MGLSFEKIVKKATEAVSKGSGFATEQIQRLEAKLELREKETQFTKEAMSFLNDFLSLDSAPEGLSVEMKSRFYALKAQITEIEEKEEEYTNLKGLVVCKNCGANISKKVFKCPECGQLNDECVDIEDFFKDVKGESIPRDIYLKDGSVLKNVVLKRISKDKKSFSFENVIGIYGLTQGDIADIK